MEARVKRDNGFELNPYDMRCMAFALDYSRELLAVDVNLSINQMLDKSWSMLRTHFEPFELGIKQSLLDQYWTN
jgi:V/A-type H+-transporting ATPase subunit B